jgi:transposase
MERRKFTREFKLEAVRLIKDRGVSVAQASHDLGVHGTVLRNWVKDFAADPEQAFPGRGQQKAEQAEIARLKREVARLKAERDILKKPRPTSRRRAREVLLHSEAPGNLAGGMVVRGARCLAWRLLCLAHTTAQRTQPQRRRAGSEGAGEAFERGRDFGAWLGLAPRQYSTGGRPILGRISKRGSKYLRTLFRDVHLLPIMAGSPYYSCGGSYYQPQYEGTNLTYVTVNDPSGG